MDKEAISIRQLSEKLFDFYGLGPLPRLDPVTQFAHQINMAAFTEQERKWIAEEELTMNASAIR